MPLGALESDSPIIVYLDFKSPYAYLSIEPTRELERELGTRFDWRPFVLDIPSYLGSAKLDRTGKVAQQNRSAKQWSGVKYAYYDCRRYASMRNMIVRGTVKIWDTHLIATAMLWAKRQGHETLHRFIDLTYAPFWKRELDVEDMGGVETLLTSAGADGKNFADWARSEGLSINAQLQAEAFDAGIYGVPTYVVDDELYFGREHLPYVRWQVGGRRGPSPDIAYPIPADAEFPNTKPKNIRIGIDSSLDSLLAIPALKSLLDQNGLNAEWVQIAPRKPRVLPAPEDESRGARHKHFRIRLEQANLKRYLPGEMESRDIHSAVIDQLKALDIHLHPEGPTEITHPVLPGVVIQVDEELYIGRQHLPSLAARFASGE